MTSPPQFAIDLALQAANDSPCAKSKRGVAAFVILNPRLDQSVHVIGTGFNGAPDGSCDGSEACRRDCAKRCVHAESRAIRRVLETGGFASCHAHLVHVKAVDGALVAGGGPSCVECSKQIVDVGLSGIWLFEHDEVPGEMRWVYYTAAEFHEATLAECGIGGPR